jgi:hypothetical protein
VHGTWLVREHVEEEGQRVRFQSDHVAD